MIFLRVNIKPRIFAPFYYFFYVAGPVGILFVFKKLIKKPLFINIILILFIVLEFAFTVNSLFFNNPKFFIAKKINYPRQREKVDRLINYSRGKKVFIDMRNHSIAYHLEDNHFSFEYINYNQLCDKIRNRNFPKYYLSYELSRKKKDLYKLIKNYYKEEFPGFYAIKKSY